MTAGAGETARLEITGQTFAAVATKRKLEATRK
jgi:hypothetical protein